MELNTLQPMKILAFETSCDDTAVALVENGTTVLSSVKVSQIEHEIYGGVVPELAARLHAENWKGALEKCLSDVNLSIEDVDCLAVTKGPGLQTSLLTGTTAASFLSLTQNIPVIPVHHILGHMSSVFLERDLSEIKFPLLSIVMSGGHSELFLQHSCTRVERLGGTLDDAAGEAFDKVAKMLGLPYPGGPAVSFCAQKGETSAFAFPRIYLTKESLDFSFSGLKAAVYRAIEDHKSSGGVIDEPFKNNVCASFQQAVTETVMKKVGRVFERFPNIQGVHFSGGVSANTHLREGIAIVSQKHNVPFRTPTQFEYCTDNAAMIGAAAYFLYTEDPRIAQVQHVDASPRMRLESPSLAKE